MSELRPQDCVAPQQVAHAIIASQLGHLAPQQDAKANMASQQVAASAVGSVGAAASALLYHGEGQQRNEGAPTMSIQQGGYVSPDVAAAVARREDAGSESDEHEHELSHLRATGRQQVVQAVHRLPCDQKSAYLEACQMAPAFILENEADPLKFLRCEDYNSWAAAVRLCRYWTERKSLFGERAYLPMTLTGDGALTREDVLNIRAGYPALLPETSTGRKVLLLDRRQCFPTASRESRMRCHFYFATIFSDDERCSTDGPLVLTLATMPRFQDIDHAFVKRMIAIAEFAFPVKSGEKHLINCPTTPAKRFAVQDLLSSVIAYNLQMKASTEGIEVHFEREPGDLRTQMLDLNLKEEGIPNYLGGKWTYSHAAEWCRSRAKFERRKYKNLLKEPGNQPLPPVAAESKDPQTRKRERNLIYSRRKRDRRKQEYQNIQQEHEELNAEKAAMLAENARLADLLNQANQIVNSLKNDDS